MDGGWHLAGKPVAPALHLPELSSGELRNAEWLLVSSGLASQRVCKCSPDWSRFAKMQCIEEMTMFQNLEIRNFRPFEHLKLEKLGRINLFGGENNSGKTSVLEALFLLGGTGNPLLIQRLNKLRGFQGFSEPVTTEAIQETVFKPLFYQFDSNKVITIAGDYDPVGFVELAITFERKTITKLPLKEYSDDSSFPERLDRLPLKTENLSPSSDTLHLSHKSSKGTYITHLHFSNDGLKLSNPPDNDPFAVATFIHARGGNPSGDASLLGNLRKRKQGRLLVDALKIMEPRLQDLEENSVAGYPMIWGDIGLPELVPLPMMGEGMTRIARIFLGISDPDVAGGVILIDEIENGIHYSTMEESVECHHRCGRTCSSPGFCNNP